MSEFRQDLVSGDWIIIAPGRHARPEDLLPPKEKRIPSSVKTCPFDHLESSGNWPPIAAYPNAKNWRLVLIPNKYPALSHEMGCLKLIKHGPYTASEGVGHHDLIVTRDHKKSFADLSARSAEEVFAMFQTRYRTVVKDPCLRYVSCFANWGRGAGASIFHPHYQVRSLPIIPPDVAHSLTGSHRYFEVHKRCVHCAMLAYERKEKIRVIAENRSAIAVAPYVSRSPYEIRIFPKKHLPYFEKTSEVDMRGIVEILQVTLRRMRRKLNDPDYNFFIHSSPLKDQHDYKHYHWHIEIIPKITTLGGFELSTDIEINVVPPESAAALLRK